MFQADRENLLGGFHIDSERCTHTEQDFYTGWEYAYSPSIGEWGAGTGSLCKKYPNLYLATEEQFTTDRKDFPQKQFESNFLNWAGGNTMNRIRFSKAIANCLRKLSFHRSLGTKNSVSYFGTLLASNVILFLVAVLAVIFN